MARKTMTLVVTMDSEGGISKGGAAPWHDAASMAWFRELTLPAPAGVQNAVIMGHRAFAALPAKHRPLSGRYTMVVSRTMPVPPSSGMGCLQTFEAAFAACESLAERIGKVFVVGGREIYAAALAHPACTELAVTWVPKQFECDTFFPSGWHKEFRMATSRLRPNSSGVTCMQEWYVRNVVK